MKISKSVLHWIIGAALSAVCLLAAYPLVLFTAGPIGALCVVLYVALTVALAIVTFRSERAVWKRVLKIVLVIPVFLLAVMLILINTYRFHLC